ncbi:MAG: hypothetical protein HQM09_15325 [Candidatus Riflebacteria bacterium]|nr:hypothetical protein [Candidatus Riflebacteria bacterium]
MHCCRSPRNMSFTLMLTSMFFILAASCLHAAALNLVYEHVIYDSSGNEIGTQRQTINSYEDLPPGNPWRMYLTELIGTQTLLGYVQNVSKSLAQPLNMTISDRDLVSASSKTSDGYNLTLYKNVTQYSSDASKKFVFLHELGHIAMLNGYPASYNFSGLNYGTDGNHYMDEILPDSHTAWIEGWANGFAATKNDGQVFTLDLQSDSTIAFLKDDTFEEMTRNELFNARVTDDLLSNGSTGRNKTFNAISCTGPHSTLKDFCNGYLSLYPQDQVTLAQILDHDSQGKMSQNDILAYVNGGSRSVSPGLASFLNNRDGTSIVSTNTDPTSSTSSTGYTGSGSTSSTSSSGGFWHSIGSFFSRLFGGIFGNKANAAATPTAAPVAPSVEQPAGFDGRLNKGGTAVSPDQTIIPPAASREPVSIYPSNGSTAVSGVNENFTIVHDNYMRAFATYNGVLLKYPSNAPEVKMALENLRAAKDRLNALRRERTH